MKHTTAIVLAAGKGARFNKTGVSKPLVKINSCPGIIYSLAILNKHPYIQDIIVVVNAQNIKKITANIRKYRISKVKNIVLGGKQRRDSVSRGLAAMNPRTALVLVHDGVRPFIDRRIVSSVIKEAARYGAAIAGVPVKATIKKIQNSKFNPSTTLPSLRSGLSKDTETKSKCRVDGERSRTIKIQNRRSLVVEKTLDRNTLWEIQTPQVFKKDLLLEAYKKYPRLLVTDDAALVERLGSRVRVVMGSYSNIKITTPEDLLIAKAIAKYRLR